MVYINGVLINSNLWRCLMMCITLINGLVLINAYIGINHRLQNLLMFFFVLINKTASATTFSLTTSTTNISFILTTTSATTFSFDLTTTSASATTFSFVLTTTSASATTFSFVLTTTSTTFSSSMTITII